MAGRRGFGPPGPDVLSVRAVKKTILIALAAQHRP
jgi:hypothetical protein